MTHLRARPWVIGAGRMGLALGAMLVRHGAVDALTYTGRRPVAPDHPLFRTAPPLASYTTGLEVPDPLPTGIILAVPDEAVARVAKDLADLSLPRHIPVLHLSGALGTEVLNVLARAGHPTGALHPLVSVADPVHGAERLRGAYFGVEATGAARALADQLVATLSGRVLPIEAGQQPLYHAAAVFASNYVVALLARAEALMERAGVPSTAARAALAELATGAAQNYAARGGVHALTGPVARGDVETVRLHRARLSSSERALYSQLAREALPLARAQGLDADTVDQLERVLMEEA